MDVFVLRCLIKLCYRRLTQWIFPLLLISAGSVVQAAPVTWEAYEVDPVTDDTPWLAPPTCGGCHTKVIDNDVKIGDVATPFEVPFDQSSLLVAPGQIVSSTGLPSGGVVGSFHWKWRYVGDSKEQEWLRGSAANIMLDEAGTSTDIQYCAGIRSDASDPSPAQPISVGFYCGFFSIERESAPIPNIPPEISMLDPGNAVTVEEGKTLTFNVTVEDENLSEIDYQWSSDNSDFVTVDPASRINVSSDEFFSIQGVSVGDATLTITVTDVEGETDSELVSVTVIPAIVGPTISMPGSGDRINLTGDSTESVLVSASTDTTSDLFYSAFAADESVVTVSAEFDNSFALTPIGKGSSNVEFTVLDEDSREDSVTVCVSVRNDPSTASTGSTGIGCNRAPSFVSINPFSDFTLSPGQQETVSLTLDDDDPDTHITTVTSSDVSVVSAIVDVDGNVVFTTVDEGYAFLTITVTDAAGQAVSAEVGVEVMIDLVPNNPPTISGHSPSGTVNMVPDSSVVVALDVSDTENNPVTLDVSSSDDDVVDVSVEGTSAVKLTAEREGSAEIKIVPSDAKAGDAYVFTVNVTRENTAPVARDDQYVFTFESSTQTLRVLDNDFDADDDSISVVLDSNSSASGGTLSATRSAIEYTPPGNFTAMDSFTYQVMDDKGARSNEARVEVIPSDEDGDGVFDGNDNCVQFPNTTQIDSDGDDLGDACDPVPFDDGELLVFGSGQTLVEAECLACHLMGDFGAPLFEDDEAWQLRIDAVGGDLSKLVESVINGRGAMPAFGQSYSAPELNAAVLYITGLEEPIVMNVLDDDLDAIANADDNCIYFPNPAQQDADGDGIGDACEPDQNADGVLDYSLNFVAQQGLDTDARAGGIIARSGEFASVTVRTRSNLSGLAYDWSKSHPRVLEVATYADDGATIQFPPASLNPAARDVVAVVTGAGVTARGRQRLVILDGGVGEAFTDSDQDGYPVGVDSDDGNARRMLANPNEATNTVIAVSEHALALGDIATVSAALGGYVSATFLLDDEAFVRAAELRHAEVEHKLIPNVNNDIGNVSLELHNLDTAQGSVVIALPGNLPLNPLLRLYKPKQGEWQALETDNGDSIGSAPRAASGCPVAQSPNYQDTLTAGVGCVRVTVTDGGVNDADERRDGVVTLILNIGSAIDPTQVGAGGSGNGGSGSGDVDITPSRGGGAIAIAFWILALVSVLLGRQQFCRNKRNIQGVKC